MLVKVCLLNFPTKASHQDHQSGNFLYKAYQVVMCIKGRNLRYAGRGSGE